MLNGLQHIVLDIVMVRLRILQHTELHGPFEEIELAARGVHASKTYAFPPRKRIEMSFAVRFQLRFVLQKHVECDISSIDLDLIDDISFLGIIGHEPIENTKRNIGASIQDAFERLERSLISVKFLERTQQDIVLGFHFHFLC